MAWFSTGSRVKVNPANDNENYDSFRSKVMIVTDIAFDGRGYDSATNEPLYSFTFEESGKSCPLSLYHYELVRA